MSAPARRAAYRRGRRSEWLAVLLLRLKGYRILERGYRTPVGEVDIVARRAGVVVFAEVKRRNSLDAAAESLRPAQRRRIARAAEAFLAQHPEHGGADLRFDAILLTPGRPPRHIPDAWREE